jgi:hypothetical protein
MARTGIRGWLPQLRFRQFCVPRQGSAPSDCLDAAAGDPDLGRFALADGASEGGPDSGRWARLLVDDFVRFADDPQPWPASLVRLQERWKAGFAYAAVPADIPWYVSEHSRARDNSAFSTFLGLSVDDAHGPNNARRWRAFAVGDSCLFQVRSGVLVERFPISSFEEFNSTPWLVGSDTSPDEIRRERGRTLDGESHPGDRIWMMTDALAEWFLLRWEVDERPWEELEVFLNPMVIEESFADWIGDMRRTAQMRNDDVTLAAVWVE